MAQTRVPHILKRIESTQCPANLFFFDTETKDIHKGKRLGLEEHKLWFGCYSAYRLEGDKRTREAKGVFNTIEEFWEIIARRLDKKRPLNVYCHNATFDMTIVDFWNKCTREKWKIDFAVLESPPVIVSVLTPEGRINVIDTLNYFKVSLKVLGKSIGLDKLECDITKASYDEALPYCQRDTEIIDKAIEVLISFVRTNRLGKLGPTVASLALSAYRHRFMATDIFIHCRERALKLEERSYHGGMVNCLYVGKVRRGWVYKLDVNSLYPFVMLNKYPVRLLYALERPTVGFISTELKRKGVIADVLIDSPREVFPYVRDKELIFPTGKFETTLCGPELEWALKCGVVKRVYYAAFYELASIFKDYVAFFWALRKQYKAKGDDANSTFCKLMLNSLYGKFGQGRYKWDSLTPRSFYDTMMAMDDYPDEIYTNADMLPRVSNGQMKWIPNGARNELTLRGVGDSVQVKRKEGHHSESFIAISSYVTSYARRYLMSLLALAGHRHCYYYDTDSLFVDKTGYDRLRRAGKCSETEIGLLKLEGKQYEPHFLAPKDYLFGSEYKLKGIRRPGKRAGRQYYQQLQFEGLPSIIKRGAEPFIRIKTIEKILKHSYKKGVINVDGWTEPFRIGPANS